MSAFILFYMLVRWTMPRFRFDQLMGLAWKVLIPLALVNLVCVMVVKQLGLASAVAAARLAGPAGRRTASLAGSWPHGETARMADLSRAATSESETAVH